ncbi:MAG TPA: hypothetical protein VGE20_08590 [Ramlibacter sp.]
MDCRTCWRKRRAGYRRAPIELIAIDLSSLSFTNHLTLGAGAAQRFGGLEQVATVVTPADRKATSEKAAQKLGPRLRTFGDVREAIDWISADPQWAATAHKPPQL